MKNLALIIVFIQFANIIFAQKAVIDPSVFGRWPSVENPAITNNGNYVFYTINNQPRDSSTLVVQSIYANWRMELAGASYSIFTQDSRLLIFHKNDSLGIVQLGTSHIKYIDNVISFKYSGGDKGSQLAYLLNTPDRKLVLDNLITGKAASFVGVIDYYLSSNGEVLLLQREKTKNGGSVQIIDWYVIDKRTYTTIWEGLNAFNFVFDGTNTQLAFATTDTTEQKRWGSVLWYFRYGSSKATRLVDNNSKGMIASLELGEVLRFSSNGRAIFIALKECSVLKPGSGNAVEVDIWNYKDMKLQSQQQSEEQLLIESHHPPQYTAVIHILDRRIVRLEFENDHIIYLAPNNEVNDSFLLVQNRRGDDNEWNWNSDGTTSVYLISIISGSRKLLNRALSERMAASYTLSPTGKYVIYYDSRRKNYFSYMISSGMFKNITEGISAVWTEFGTDLPDVSEAPYPVGGWIKGDEAVLLFDQFDIWQVDPAGVHPPINITNAYGRRNNILFRLAMDYQNKTIQGNSRLMLNAFSRDNKDNGFYSIILSQNTDPQLLTMQHYIFKGPEEGVEFPCFTPIKARDAEVYLVRRMSASESPNYFFTTDFKSFMPVSNVYPEWKYNWFTSTLSTFITLDDRPSQGILYRPENFDERKKYPVIITNYEKVSNTLHAYIEPQVCYGAINIPFFVSDGYLVFAPDIHYMVSEPGRSAYNTIVAAVNYLSKLPFVDTQKIGIQGHSRGGYQTNYLISHTDLFAAAMSSSGFCDFASLYGGVRANGTSRQSGFELYAQRIGATLWQRVDLYVENSPIFKADKVCTPLLMMNNGEDQDIPFAQGVEFFTALRRIGRKVWMLQYEREGHLVFDRAAVDLTIRMKLFFDHYLKEAPPPKWMTIGIRAAMKGSETGYDFDPAGNCGTTESKCKVCEKWNEKYRKTPLYNPG